MWPGEVISLIKKLISSMKMYQVWSSTAIQFSVFTYIPLFSYICPVVCTAFVLDYTICVTLLLRLTIVFLGSKVIKLSHWKLMGLLYCIPVNPWLLGAMGKGLCCIASWWSLVSCGEIAAEEDCDSEREEAEREMEEMENTGRRKRRTHIHTHHSQYRQLYKQTFKIIIKKSHITRYCCEQIYS